MPVYNCVYSQLLVGFLHGYSRREVLRRALKRAIYPRLCEATLFEVSLTCFGIKTITLARFPLRKILEKSLGAECCILYFPFSLKCKHHYHDNEFCSDYGKCGNRCYCVFINKVDCENKQRLFEFWELWMQIKATASYGNVSFVWWCYFTAKDLLILLI